MLPVDEIKLRGQVIRARNNFYDVRVSNSPKGVLKTLVCQLRGSLKRDLRSIKGKRIYADPVSVGDWVELVQINQEQGVIESLLPRQTKLARRHPVVWL